MSLHFLAELVADRQEIGVGLEIIRWPFVRQRVRVEGLRSLEERLKQDVVDLQPYL